MWLMIPAEAVDAACRILGLGGKRELNHED